MCDSGHAVMDPKGYQGLLKIIMITTAEITSERHSLPKYSLFILCVVHLILSEKKLIQTFSWSIN